MIDQSSESKLHAYDVAITVQMPGQTRANTYHLKVQATSLIDAVVKGGTEWRKITEPRDLQVREADVIVA